MVSYPFVWRAERSSCSVGSGGLKRPIPASPRSNLSRRRATPGSSLFGTRPVSHFLGPNKTPLRVACSYLKRLIFPTGYRVKKDVVLVKNRDLIDTWIVEYPLGRAKVDAGAPQRSFTAP